MAATNNYKVIVDTGGDITRELTAASATAAATSATAAAASATAAAASAKECVAIGGDLIDSEQYVTFANSAVINTQKTVTLAAPDEVRRRYLLVCYNPSTVTDLTVKIMASRTMNSTTVNTLIATVKMEKSQAISGTTISANSVLIEGVFIGAGLNLIISNNTALGSSGGFSAYFDLLEAD